MSYKHSSRWSFGDTIWHKVTKDKGMIVAIHLRNNSPPNYGVIWEDDREDKCHMEFELTDVEPAKFEAETKADDA
jgi:hypothetical protein